VFVNKFGESQNKLLQAYQLWRDLTVREGAALHNEDWLLVRECQSAKSELQSRILRWTESAQQESLPAVTSCEFNHQLRNLLSELISLEKHHSESVQRRRRTAEAQKKELDHTHKTLGRIHRTYRQSVETCWSSYS
jgi:hypothetical protein